MAEQPTYSSATVRNTSPHRPTRVVAQIIPSSRCTQGNKNFSRTRKMWCPLLITSEPITQGIDAKDYYIW
jgi:hypothetical protein